MSDGRPAGLFSRGRLQEPMGPRLVQHALLKVVGGAVAVCAGIFACYRLIVWARTLGELGFGGLIFLVAMPFVFALGVLAYALAVAVPFHLAVKHDSKPAMLVFLALNAVALLVMYAGMVQPIREANEAEARQKAAAAAELEQRRAAQEVKRQAELREWLRELQASGAYGPPGAVPPMLKVEDDGLLARVTKLGSGDIPVQLDRIRRAADGSPAVRCPMTVVDRVGVAYQAGTNLFYLFPQKDYVFTAAPKCAEAFKGAPLEFRVGGTHPAYRAGWWTETALKDAL
jgi:hypothetical protein